MGQSGRLTDDHVSPYTQLDTMSLVLNFVCTRGPCMYWQCQISYFEVFIKSTDGNKTDFTRPRPRPSPRPRPVLQDQDQNHSSQDQDQDRIHKTKTKTTDRFKSAIIHVNTKKL